MKKRLDQKGFSLIEVVVALLLFSLLMGSLWEFFGNTYSVYTQFDKKTNLDDEARRISSFIREEIRLADKVAITLEDNSIIYPPNTTGSSIEIKDKQLKIINLNTTGGGTKKPSRSIKLSSNGLDKSGQLMYKLEYTANGTPSLISDKIKNIKITKEKDSSIVEFTCEVRQVNDTQEIKNVFSESLEYKEKYTP